MKKTETVIGDNIFESVLAALYNNMQYNKVTSVIIMNDIDLKRLEESVAHNTIWDRWMSGKFFTKLIQVHGTDIYPSQNVEQGIIVCY